MTKDRDLTDEEKAAFQEAFREFNDCGSRVRGTQMELRESRVDLAVLEEVLRPVVINGKESTPLDTWNTEAIQRTEEAMLKIAGIHKRLGERLEAWATALEKTRVLAERIHDKVTTAG